MKINITGYLDHLVTEIIAAERLPPKLNTAWVNSFPPSPGVYIFRQGSKIVYVGESGNLRGRMRDLLDTRHHTLRRSIGAVHFSSHALYTRATAKKRFCDEIEIAVNQLFGKKLKISYLVVPLGRKELEEKLFALHEPVYNKKGLRLKA